MNPIDKIIELIDEKWHEWQATIGSIDCINTDYHGIIKLVHVSGIKMELIGPMDERKKYLLGLHWHISFDDETIVSSWNDSERLTKLMKRKEQEIEASEGYKRLLAKLERG